MIICKFTSNLHSKIIILNREVIIFSLFFFTKEDNSNYWKSYNKLFKSSIHQNYSLKSQIFTKRYFLKVIKILMKQHLKKLSVLFLILIESEILLQSRSMYFKNLQMSYCLKKPPYLKVRFCIYHSLLRIFLFYSFPHKATEHPFYEVNM